MATMNPFDLLGDGDTEDPSQLAAAAAPPPKKAPAQAKLPSKPLPPSQAVREAKNEVSRGGRGFGRGRGAYNRDRSSSEENAFSNSGLLVAPEDGNSDKPSERRSGYGGPRGGGGNRGRRQGGLVNGEANEGERPRRAFERHSGTGRGNEMKRDGAGRGNWGSHTDDITQVAEEAVDEGEKISSVEKPVGEEEGAEGNQENPENQPEEKEPEDKEMTLEEYEKVLEEKRKALQALKTEERKVDAKEFESMRQLSSKKANDDIFIKLGAEKDKRKETYEKDEKAKKSLSINEFLKPAEGERHYSPGGRGRGRGRGPRGYGGREMNMAAPWIEDPGQFPTLGAK